METMLEQLDCLYESRRILDEVLSRDADVNEAEVIEYAVAKVDKVIVSITRELVDYYKTSKKINKLSE